MEQQFERRRWLLPLVLAILTIVLLRPVIWPPEANWDLDGRDFPAMFYPLHDYIRQTVVAGEMPLWNPHQFVGHPIIGNPHAALFYPATWFMWLVGTIRGMNIVLAFHSWLAAWGMAHLARRFGATYIGGLMAGIVYAMSAWAAAHYFAGHYNLLVLTAWIPWGMAFYHYALQEKTWRSTLPGIAVFGISLLAGHPPMMVYYVMGLASLWVYHIMQAEATRDDLLRAVWEATRQLAAIGIGGLILGGALAIPALELARVSARQGNDISFVNSFALPPAQFISLALPGFFGNPRVGPYHYWGADFFEEFTAYPGMIPLLAIPLAFRWKRREVWYFIGLIALGVILSVGVDGALTAILFRWVPGFGMFRTPGRALYYVMFGVAGLTALLISALQRAPVEERREALRSALRLWIPIGAGVAFLGAIYFAGWYSSASHVEPMPLRAFTVASSLAGSGVALLGAWFVLWLWSEPDPKAARWALLMTFLVITLDAWHVAIPLITVSEIKEDPVWAGARIDVPVTGDSRVVAPVGWENLASVTGHLNILGYDPLPVESYFKLQAAADFNDPAASVNTLSGVKYFFTTKPYDNQDWELIGIQTPGIYYRRKNPFPRAWVVKKVVVEPNDETIRQKVVAKQEDFRETVYTDRAVDCATGGGGDASITVYRPNDVEIKTSGNGGLMVLSDQFYPGWQASVDGKPVDTVRTMTAFRGVCVAAGEHTVKFEYRPLSLVLGIILSAVGWIGWVVLFILAALRMRRQNA